MTEPIFTDGLSVRKVSDTLFGISINVDKFVEFMYEHKTEKGYVNINILKSKEKNSWYGKLNTWTPDKKTEPKQEDNTLIGEDEIPF